MRVHRPLSIGRPCGAGRTVRQCDCGCSRIGRTGAWASALSGVNSPYRPVGSALATHRTETLALPPVIKTRSVRMVKFRRRAHTWR